MKFENYYAYGSREIDYVVDHFIENTQNKTDSIRVILGELCKLLADDQQKNLVEILNKNFFIENYARNHEYVWNPVNEIEEENT
jgi:hypothetical protein